VVAAVRLVEPVLARLQAPGSSRPFLVGVAGPVAVGKSVLADALRAALVQVGHSVEVVSTDGFLLPNAVLAVRGLEARKGFPESYDRERLVEFLGALRSGATEVAVPVYSHERYDVVPGEERVFDDLGVVIIEGVNALQSPIVDELDVAVYVDADEDHVLRWYTERFQRLRAGDLESHPFYAAFTSLTDADLTGVAELVWREVNGRNLREHILPSRERADVVVTKDADHSLVSVTSRWS
jgi:type I pantothenate kinase